MKSYVLVILSTASLLLAACVTQDANNVPSAATDSGRQELASQAPPETPSLSSFANRLAQDLRLHMRQPVDPKAVGITSLVAVDGQLQQADTISKLFSEDLIYAMHGAQFKVLDYKTTDFIRVTAKGDFALSRDYLELQEIVPISHVLVATTAQHEQGMMVNARLVNITDKQVISAAQVFIPKQVLRQVQSSELKPILRAAR
ncbi:FlgO family outer membrane protein [Idiomarina xiamenensis]|uniref:FlgO domain-containing protein n=1 Tax=Idiomarina xiamenensis 10-D-4 TaxID=740709 RepID=K2K665_9GAMM|nr:FlgO family outer membrane protein [Idiomarina xiamenensis]EKE82087.1 hypothetical protein A10D4_09929 [Idiomarina xiamenensis 10-D-4]